MDDLIRVPPATTAPGLDQGWQIALGRMAFVSTEKISVVVIDDMPRVTLRLELKATLANGA